ncbi:MAG TPA: GntR family transcriptional regulator, partial [Tepidisphaeraceae bacterium]|nr:GntR family transcriptional regulator [Tepidisphaeraceae bacterium]
MSYKFQRLRERIRHAVASGELAGKLPGERELARRFHVNAKTLSKALTDLAAEGLLQRSIGRGTFVKGSEPAADAHGPWLLVCDSADNEAQLIASLQKHNSSLQVIQDIATVRPSFLHQFTAVIDISVQTPDFFLRDLIVRNIPL